MPTVSCRVRPMAEHGWSDSLSDTCSLLPASAHQGSGGVGAEEWAVQVYRPRHDYAVRRAFLTSYQFSVRESFRKRMARAMRELAVDAMSVLRGIPDRVSPRRMGSRMVRALLQGLHHLPSSLSPVRCFVGAGNKCVAA
ncbi:hypothetical protein Taro_054583 [Colocasia esculenta]|uniref:Uncharacterized protein n=1 Tax=Colocasia esculenta TaxID=4460 RepID=A0A843XR18_COLES|nr:hypothetical protein [Colocasia esculenta]